MDNLITIAGKNGCGGDGGAKTGKLGCQIEFGTPRHLFKLQKGLVIPGSTVMNLAYLNGLIQEGKLTPLVDASSFEDVSGEDTMSTNSRGIERLNLLGLPKYKLMFEEGHEFYKEMSKLTSFKTADFLIGDEFGNIKIAINSAGDFVGFSAGQILAEMTKTKVAGGDAESKSLTVQFTNRKQWDQDYTVISNSQLDFDLIEVQGVNGVELTLDAIPVNGDTVIRVIAMLSADKHTPVEGLELGNFIATEDSVTNAITVVNEVEPGVYDLTMSAVTSTKVLLVEFWDATKNSKTILLDNILYCTNGASETVLV